MSTKLRFGLQARFLVAMAVTLAVVFAGPLRNAGSLVVTSSQTIPDVGAWLCIAGIVLSLATLPMWAWVVGRLAA